MGVWLSAMLLAGAACASGDADRQLHINDVQVIGTHNSYKQPLPVDELAAHRAVDPDGADGIDYGFPPLTEQLEHGIRQLELDIYDDPNGGRYLHPPGAHRKGFTEPPWSGADRAAMARPGFKVMHLADIDFRSSCVAWSGCLQSVRRWSVGHPEHLPVLILINAKDGPLGPGSAQPLPFNEAAFDRLDAETRSVFSPEELITPAEVQGNYPTLRAAVLAGRWPILERARGRILFVLDEGPEKIAAYRGHRRSLEGRVMFVGTRENSDLASILVINDPLAEQDRIRKAVADGFLVRTRADADTREARKNDPSRREAALASGAQFISTDYFDAVPRLSNYQVRFAGNGSERMDPLRTGGACQRTEPDRRTEPDLVLHGSLTGADNQTWRLVPFDVPAGTARITVDFDYTMREQRTTIDLGILGPDGFRGQDGFRGWSGGNKRTFTIAATDATPSYLPGPIRPGKWNLLLGVPNIRPDTRAGFTAEVRLEREAGGGRPGSETVLRDTPGWYRGDLHMHTAHSDGSCLSHRQQRVPCPLFFTVKAASDRGLDFIAITDHNTVSHVDAMRELQPYFDDLLLIPGREITTFHGHANLFGSVAPIDFRVGSEEVPDWGALLGQVERSGGVISINHPIRPSGEQCMGCGWTPPPGVDYRRLQGVEVVNGPDADTQYSGIPFWEHLLEQGYHLTALGGSDNHDALNGTIGTPTTVIYADSLSRTGIVEGIRRGRVFIDVAGTRDRFLDVTASANGQIVHMGDTLRVSRGARISFKGVVRGVGSGQLVVILNGQRVRLLKDASVGSQAQAFEFTWRADGRPHWIRVDVRDAQSHLALLGNPIYLR